MVGYFGFISEYIGAILRRWDTACGIVIGLITLALFLAGVGVKLSLIIPLVATGGLFIEATYGVYRVERSMRSKLERSIRIETRVGSYSQNYPDPGEDKVSIKVFLQWEMWAKVETVTDQLALNVIYVYKKRFWQFWRKRKSPKFGMTRNDQASNQYRHTLPPPGALQPHKDEGTFTWVGDRKEVRALHGFELELVLVTGMPVSRYSQPVSIHWGKVGSIESREANLPL